MKELKITTEISSRDKTTHGNERIFTNDPQLQLWGKDDGINYGARKCKVWMK